MAATRSKSPSKGKDATRVDAHAVDQDLASLARKKEDKMAEVSSIVEFSEDIDSAEAVPPLPESDYPFEIKSAVKKESQKGTSYAELGCYISPESYPVDYTDGDPDGTLLYYRRVSLEDTPASRHRIRKFCEAIGVKPPKGRLDLNEWIGATGIATIKHEQYEGEDRAQIVKVVAP